MQRLVQSRAVRDVAAQLSISQCVRTKDSRAAERDVNSAARIAQSNSCETCWRRIRQTAETQLGTRNHLSRVTMERVEVESFSQATNAWVVRTPGRHFPALVIQGDSFSDLFARAQSLLDGLRAASPAQPQLVQYAEELRDLLWRRVQHYETVLRENGFDLPYTRDAWPR